MTCTTCNKYASTVWNVAPGQWECKHCRTQEVETNFGVIDTVNFKYYYRNGGNVSAKRVEMFKSRCLSPDDGRTVVMRSKSGMPSDRKAVNY